MPGTATSADAGDIATHNWKTLMPDQADEGQPTACSACHANPRSGVMQITTQAITQIIASRQDEVESKIKALNKLLKDTKSVHPEWDPKAGQKTGRQIAYEKALTYVSFVETDGSLGLHNYEYAQAVLAKAEEELMAGAMATSTPTPEPTQTPQPTSTPFVPPPTPTPVPAPSGGTTWSMWALLLAVIGVVMALLLVRRPDKTS
jgi:hypothetical protein